LTRGARILRDQADPPATDAGHAAFGKLKQVVRAQRDPARHRSLGRQQTHRRQKSHRLPRPRLPHDAKGFAAMDDQAQILDRRRAGKPDMEVTDRQDRGLFPAGWRVTGGSGHVVPLIQLPSGGR